MLRTKKAIIYQLKEKKERFDIACVHMFEDLSRKKIKSIIDNGGGYLNKKRIKFAKEFVKIGDCIELFWDENAQITKKIDQKNIIFENSDFIILNKPAGVPVQGTLENDKNTILHLLNAFSSDQYALDHLFLVHRLDKETSGLLIVAKNQAAQKKFEDLFREHKINKSYSALSYFAPKESKGVISYAIAKDVSRTNTYFAVTNKKTYPSQKSAETSYVVEKICKHGVALISCYPKTGRTHQIRVHLLAIGCPIIGDKTYAQNVHGHPYARSASRQLLHASQLAFEFDGRKYTFLSELPKDFIEFLKVS